MERTFIGEKKQQIYWGMLDKVSSLFNIQEKNYYLGGNPPEEEHYESLKKFYRRTKEERKAIKNRKNLESIN